MDSSTKRPLLVLNASAGSGKTYNLVRNYLVLLLKEASGKADLGQIVAMTFTNKAAYEMKTRIIRDLNKLSNPTEKDRAYVNEIALLVEQQPDELQRNARMVLRKMLHRYEDFNVLTIDKFNLRLIRSFSRDLNLPEQFDIVLDERMILEKAVDELLSTIDKDEQNRIYRLAINFARNNLDEETRWDVKRALMESAAILTDERSYNVIRNLREKEFLQEEYDLWKLQLKQYQQDISQWQRDVQLALESSGLQMTDFHFGKNTWNRIQGIVSAKGTAAALNGVFEQTDYYLNNFTKTQEKTGQPEPGNTIFRFWEFWTRIYPAYFALELKVKQFYLLGILRELAIFMENIREKDAVIRVSEFNKLVSELVKDEEAPFIYERLGNRFRHFFLDEFQDTSRLQWMNLVPLVHESLAHGQFNLIVGDPKQSIYRFKNGVAEQFVALPRIYNPEKNPSVELKSDFFDRLGQLEGLTENWRSSQEIVAFNNAFFEALKGTLPPSGVPYYNQVTQHPRGKTGGFIEFVMIPKTEESAAEVEANLLRWVETCLADGYDPSDICVLARLKSECNTYANILKNNGHQVVSADSLLVSSDQYVQLIIAYCRLRNHPDHRQLLMRFAELFLRLFSPDTAFDAYQSCFETTPEGKQFFAKELFFAHSVFHQKDLSRGFQDIFSLIQGFVREYGIDELQNAYVHQLLDLAAQFDLHNGPDLSGFLSYYDNIGNRTNVQLPENRHSIKVMTAHKSKGLEFPVVILPSVRFEVGSTKKNTRIFESGGHFVQSKLSEADRVLPEVDPHVTVENEAAVMDYVNLLYVAFTRPIDRLYFMGTISSRDSLQKTIFQTLAELYPQFVNGPVMKGTIGIPPAITPETEEEDLSFEPVSLNGYLWFPYISILSEEEQDELQLTRERRFGRQFHAIMEYSNSIAEAEDAIARGLLKGTIEAEFKDALKVQAEQLFANAQYAALLEGGHQLDEQTLLVDTRTRLRPDKIILHPDRTVVIDFKTGERKPEHRTQVAKYAYALGLMGFPEIEGWLYYVSENELVKVSF